MKNVNETFRDSHFSAWQSSPWQEAAHRDIRLRWRVRPILQRADISMKMYIWRSIKEACDRSYKEQISEYQWKLSWGTQPSSDVTPILQRADVWISEEEAFGDFLGRHNHHLHGLQNSRTTSNDPHNSSIDCLWRQSQMTTSWTTTLSHHKATTSDHNNWSSLQLPLCR